MAIIHYDVTFAQETPSIDAIRRRLQDRTGLEVHFERDPLDKDAPHLWPHIGQVRESASFECDEADGVDLEVTVGTEGVRITCVAPGLNHYFRDQCIATLVDLGGQWGQVLPDHVQRKWGELTPEQQHR